VFNKQKEHSHKFHPAVTGSGRTKKVRARETDSHSKYPELPDQQSQEFPASVQEGSDFLCLQRLGRHAGQVINLAAKHFRRLILRIPCRQSLDGGIPAVQHQREAREFDTCKEEKTLERL